MVDKIFISGITGNLGSSLAVEILRQGKQILALVRNKGNESVKKRLDVALDIAGAGCLRNNVELIRGDICKKRLGVKLNSSKWKNVSKIIHCAASTTFQDNTEELSYATNVEGTLNMLDIAADLSIPIVYTSTAYVAGKRNGIVKEGELDVGQSFTNIYEYTKCRAEKAVHIWAQQNSLPAVVLRPSIVLGDSRFGRTVRFNSMYDIIRVLDLVIPYLGSDEILIPGKAEATKNIVPVDYFAQVASYIINHRTIGTYHITNPKPLTLESICNIFSELLNSYRYKLVGLDYIACQNDSNVQRALLKACSQYITYMTGEPIFDRTNTDSVLAGSGVRLPPIDISYFRRLLNYARSVKWGKNRDCAYKQVSSLQKRMSQFIRS